jgi:hypothetical protein
MNPQEGFQLFRIVPASQANGKAQAVVAHALRLSLLGKRLDLLEGDRGMLGAQLAIDRHAT